MLSFVVIVVVVVVVVINKCCEWACRHGPYCKIHHHVKSHKGTRASVFNSSYLSPKVIEN